MPDNVFVVIVTFNGEEYIDACLKSVYKSHCEVSVIVVDNNSGDNTVNIIENKFPQTAVVRNHKNEGFGGANNIGINLALAKKSEFIFLLNQDTIIEATTIPTLIQAMQTDNEFSVLSPIHLDDRGDALDKGFAAYVHEDLKPDQLSVLHASKERRIFEVSFVNAAAWMVRMDTFKRVGGFAPLFFHYGEDRDFVNRMRYHNFKIGILTGSFIRHLRGSRANFNEWGQSRLDKYYKTGWTSRASNINVTLFKGWTDGFIWSLKEAFFYLLKGNVRVLIAFIVSLAQLIWSIPSIMRHRAEVRSLRNFKFLSCE